MLLQDHPAFKPKSNQTDQPTKSESNRKFCSVTVVLAIIYCRKIIGNLTIFSLDVHNYLNDLKKKGETQSGDDVGHYISKLKNKVKMNKNFQLYKSKPTINLFHFEMSWYYISGYLYVYVMLEFYLRYSFRRTQ